MSAQVIAAIATLVTALTGLIAVILKRKARRKAAPPAGDQR